MPTGQLSLVTCSQFEHSPDGPPISTVFITLCYKLMGLNIEGAPRVIDAGIDDATSAFWIARAHFEDAVSLAEFVVPSRETPLAFAIHVGTSVANTLGQFAENGLSHGGLDPRTTIAVRGDGTPIVLDTGYQYLFGLDHFEQVEGQVDLEPPEQKAGGDPDFRGDMYTLGVILSGMLSGASTEGGRSASVHAAIKKATASEPTDRFDRWSEFYNALKA